MTRANANNLTERCDKNKYILQIFCKEKTCKMPLGINDRYCDKCGRDIQWEDMVKAVATQNRLKYENKRNKKYVPPALYI
jgi:hypothetical protein